MNQPFPDPHPGTGADADFVIANAQLVLPDRIARGALVVKDGLIHAIDTGSHLPAGALDFEGDYLIPGMIELHTDNLERHLEPRPGVHWPHDAAILAHDAELAGAGITTVFDALRIGFITARPDETAPYARSIVSELMALRELDALSISHFVHIRAEICSDTLLDDMKMFDAGDRIRLVSLMDHTPGQRQFRSLDKLREYSMGRSGMTEAQFDQMVKIRIALGDQVREPHEQAVLDFVKRTRAALASHDDTTVEQVVHSAQIGASIAEFPTSLEAAAACREHGIHIIAGAPNVLRGKSHSGNVSALDLAERDHLDILSSDYVPRALLLAAFKLGDVSGNLAKSIATVTANPAKAVGLTDRGMLRPGLQADLVRVRKVGQTYRTSGGWRRGMRVA